MKIVLASASPRRRELLKELVPDFRVLPAKGEERADPSLSPEETVKELARRKAEEVAALIQNRECAVLGADTVIVFRDAVIGKPRDEADALRILLSLAGKTHEVVTGLALLRGADGFRRIWRETTRVTFKPFGRETAERYLSLVSVLDKAGAYAIQESGEFLVESVDGSIENVIGLPLERLQEELMRLND